MGMADLVKGWTYLRRACTLGHQLAMSRLKRGASPAQTFLWRTSATSFSHHVAVDYWTTPLSTQERGCLDHHELVTVMHSYDFSFHEYMTKRNAVKTDMFVEINNEMANLQLRWADLSEFARGNDKWEDAEIKMHQQGENMFSEYMGFLGLGVIIDSHTSKLRMMAAEGVSFKAIDAIPNSHPSAMTWTLPDQTAFSMHREAIVLHARIHYFLGAPTAVERSDLTIVQPSPQCRWLNDRMDRTSGVGNPLGALMSKVALEVGDFDLAVAHGKAGAALHKSPFKLFFSRFALAHGLVNGGSALSVEQPQPLAPTEETSVALRTVERNPRLEKQHRRLLVCLNDGNLGDFQQMITDDVTSIDPMGKERTGREWVGKTMAKSIATFQGKFGTDDEGEVECELTTLSADETGARYKIAAMGMQMTIGDRVKWDADGHILVMRSRMNPPEGEW